ncbi:MAG TPA: YdeI/OmpD-associated family protein [Methanomassiliicoccales archaeon]|nr:YdeI/OmpD-associated family protein [Methanomassiliicoccales archaeon]
MSDLHRTAAKIDGPKNEGEMILELPDRRSWHEWLDENHDSGMVVWLVIYKRSTCKDWITYPEALEEALSFGWIDSRMRRVDSEKHSIRFTKRRSEGNWSVKNLVTAKELISQGRMTEHGQKVMPVDLDSELHRARYRDKDLLVPPEDLRKELEDEGLLAVYEAISPSHRRAYFNWISQARRPETRAKRIAEAIEHIRRGDMPFDMTRWRVGR